MSYFMGCKCDWCGKERRAPVDFHFAVSSPAGAAALAETARKDGWASINATRWNGEQHACDECAAQMETLISPRARSEYPRTCVPCLLSDSMLGACTATSQTAASPSRRVACAGCTGSGVSVGAPSPLRCR